MAEVVWSVDATRDLASIHAYISQQSAEYADAVISRLIEAVSNLADFPELGRVVPEYGQTRLRELLFQNYRIVYRFPLGPGLVGIVGVVHGAVDLRRRAQRQRWDLA